MLIKIRNSIMNRTWKEVSMKAEKYLLEYMMKSNIPAERVKKDMGIDVQALVSSRTELMADELIRLCIYLGVNPDDMMNELV